MIEYLQKIDLFEGCSVDDIKLLATAPHRLPHFSDEELIIRQGAHCLSLMLLVEGGIESRMGGEEGREVVVERHIAPQVLAPAFLYATDNTMPVEVVAFGKSTVLYINKEIFFSFLCSHPTVLRRFLATVSNRTRALSNKVRSFAVTVLRGRVTEYLSTHESITNISAVAEMLGVARPSLSRVLAEMVDEGLLQRSDTGITTYKQTY